MSKLSIGDVVMWSGTWGRDPARPATVRQISVCENPGDHSDVEEFDSLDWSAIKGREVVIDLTSNHWAWGFQIQPLSKGEAV